MSTEPAPYLLRLSAPTLAAGYEQVLFAYRVPFLPDFVSARGITGQTEHELLSWALETQAGIIGALANWHEHAFVLRYLFQPERPTIEIALLLRAVAPAGQGGQVAGALGRTLVPLFGGAGMALKPVTDDAALRAFLDPPGHTYFSEIRQHEELAPMLDADAYVVCPFRPPATPWTTIFESLMRQPAPCALSIHLQPTRLTADERTAFEQAASQARGAEHFQFSGYRTAINQTDAMATVVGGLYTDYLRRLAAPYLLVTQVASPHPQVSGMLAGMLTREMTQQVDLRAAQAQGQLPCGADIVTPQTPQDAVAAHTTFAYLDPQLWGPTQARPAQWRLRFLTDAHTAAAAFRFPVATRGPIPGVKMRAPAQTGQGAGKIFLSYRRGDSAATTGRIYDRLAERFGKDALFYDVSDIPLGTDFMRLIHNRIQQSAVQLIVIGPHWIDATDAKGARRLDEATDPVRQEVEVGLASGVLVIPLLIDGAGMPAAEQLPATLRALPTLNARPVRHMDFDHDMAAIIAAIEERLRRGAGA